MQIIIDGCKREYEIDSIMEIERIKRLDCMTLTKPVMVDGKTKYIRCDFPRFMQYTKAVKNTKEGKPIPDDVYKKNKNKLKSRINDELVCPMNYLEDCLDKIQGISHERGSDIGDYFIKMSGVANNRQMTKIVKIVDHYDSYITVNYEKINTEEGIIGIIEETNKVIDELKQIKIGNPKTINRLIESALNIESNIDDRKRYREATKHTRKLLNLLYLCDKERFLQNFVKKQ